MMCKKLRVDPKTEVVGANYVEGSEINMTKTRYVKRKVPKSDK